MKKNNLPANFPIIGKFTFVFSNRWKTAWFVFWLAGAMTAQGNLLSNPGFESGSGTDADNWSRWSDCGREGWAAESGSYGMAFWGWNSAGGGFRQLSISAGANTRYYLRVRGYKDNEFANCDIACKLEFYQSDAATLIGAVTNIYPSGSIAAGSWQTYSVTGAVLAGTAYVRPEISYPARPPTGSGSQSYKWDGALMYDRTLNYADGEIVEEFSYDPDYDNALNDKDRGNGFTNHWIESNPGSFTIADGSFGNVSGYPINHGNKAVVTPGNGEVRAAYRPIRPVAGGSLYVACLVNYEFSGADKWMGLSLMSNDSERAFLGEISAADQRFGLSSYEDGGNCATSSYTLTAGGGNDYLIVGKYDFGERTFQGKAYWKTDEIPSVEPVSWDATVTVSVDRIVFINGLRIGAGGPAGQTPGACYFDEVRAATNWEGLLLIPTPTVRVIYEGFAPSSGRLYHQSGGTGWGTNLWECLDNDQHAYAAGSMPSNRWSYPSVAGNKGKLDATANGSLLYATRQFDSSLVMTTGQVYFSWIQNFDHAGGADNGYAGLYLMSNDAESVFVGKVPGANVLGLKWLGAAADTNSQRTVLNGTGNDYVFVAKYDFSTRALSANAYGTNEVIGEEPQGYWDVTATLAAGHIQQVTGIRMKGGIHLDNLNNIGNVYFDELRIGTNWFEVARRDGLTKLNQLRPGPTAELIFVGTNYTIGATNDLIITDGQLVNPSDPLDFAVRWRSPYGIFMTNQNESFNLSSRNGRVCPNWDPLSRAGAGVETALGKDTNFTGLVGYNGAVCVTTYVQNAFNLTNTSWNDTYYVAVSGETDPQTADAGGYIAAPNGADDVPVRRALTINSNLLFSVVDDDTNYPAAGAGMLLESANLLSNPSFETGSGADAADWFRMQDTGREPWGAQSGSYGMAFWSWNSSYGYFGQNVTVAVGAGQLVCFSISVNSEPNFTSSSSDVKMVLEFWAGATMAYALTNNIYSAMLAHAGSWGQHRFLCTNNVAGITKVVPVIDSRNWGGAGCSSCAVKWDDASLSLFTLIGKPLSVFVGAADYSTIGTIVTHTLTDAQLVGLNAGSPLRLIVEGYDQDSGLSRGTNAPDIQTILHIDNLATNDGAHYWAEGSSSSSTNSGTTNTWRWTEALAAATVQSMMDAGSNAVSMTIRDADLDRAGDQLSLSNVLVGYLKIVDDDALPPDISGSGGSYLRFNGEPTTIYDRDLANNLTITTRVKDASSGVFGGTSNQFWLYKPTGLWFGPSNWTVTPAQGSAQSSYDAGQTLGVEVPVPYDDRVLGVWTCAIAVTDCDTDRADDNFTVVSNLPFAVIDDDADYPSSGSGTLVESGNLLINPGFEAGSGADASSWFRMQDAGREPWGARSGSYGMAFWSWNTSYGYFGQNVTVSVSAGQLLAFSIWVNAEPNFTSTSSDVNMILEFWAGATMAYALTNNIYSDMLAHAGSWGQHRFLCTNNAAGITKVVPVIDSRNWGGAGCSSCAVKWDDASLTSFTLTGKPLRVYVGATDYSSAGVIVTHNLTDGQLAGLSGASPLRLMVEGYDKDSGLAFETGSSEIDTVIHVDHMTTNDGTHYWADGSSVITTNLNSTNTWRWSSALDGATIQAMIDAGSNAVSITVRDADVDRPADQLCLSNVVVGYLKIVDDDALPPDISGLGGSYLRFNGNASTISDADLARNLTITTRVKDAASGVFGGASNQFWLYKPSGLWFGPSNWIVTPVEGSAQSLYQSSQVLGVDVPVPYDDRVLGTWTCLIAVTEFESDRPGDAFTVVSNLPFTVVDDDTAPPVRRTFSDNAWGAGMSANYFIVATNGLIVSTRSDSSVNVHFRVTDGYLAQLSPAQSFQMVFGAMDVGSGLSRTNEGSATNVYMSYSVGTALSGVITGFDQTLSSPPTTNAVMTNVWTFTDNSFITRDVISNLVFVPGGSNAVWVTIPDSDSDRTNDQAVLSSDRVGWLSVVDDDSSKPVLSSVHFNGVTNRVTDESLAASGFSFTGLVQDASGIVGTNNPTLQLFNPAGAISGTEFMTNPLVADGSGVAPVSVGRTNLPVAFADRILGTWTARVSVTDLDDDGWGLGDRTTTTTNYAFLVVDEDTQPPSLIGGKLTAGSGSIGSGELFISEYVEGSSFNKYIEIFNGTDSPVDLGGYFIAVYFDGNTTPTGVNNPIPLSGSLLPGAVYVLAHSSAAGWSGVPDQTSGNCSFNGNDAVALLHQLTTVDVVGVIGDAATFAEDATLVRKMTVINPSTTYAASQWESHAMDAFDFLGSHSGPATDWDLRSGLVTITGQIQDASGIYISESAPSYAIYNNLGAACVTAHAFSQQPAVDGAAASPEPLSDLLPAVGYSQITVGIWTARVTSTDYDLDRPSDSITGVSSVAFTVIDDDPGYPVVGNLLVNPGFEEGAGAAATGWFCTADAGREAWAWMNGVAGMAFWSWNASYGSFGQFVEAKFDAGQVVTFTIWGNAEPNFTSLTSEGFMKIEFWSGASMAYAVTNDIYAQLLANAGNWSPFRFTCTNSANGITRIAPMIVSGNWGGSCSSCSLKWDNATLSLGRPLQVFVNGTNATSSDFGVAVHTVTDGDLADLSSLQLVLEGYDSGSGLLRGAADPGTGTVLHVSNLTTNDGAHYWPAGSSLLTTTPGATSAWQWTSALTGPAIQALMNGGSNAVLATFRDADFDRVNDQLSLSNRLAGYLRVIDDDTTAPTAGPLAGTLLYNSSFELLGSASNRAYAWEPGTSDGHGMCWGPATREPWRARSGAYALALNNWSLGTNAGVWQQVTNNSTAGTTWNGSAWFWSDNGVDAGLGLYVFTAAVCQVKIEFFDGAFNLIDSAVQPFMPPGETWTQITLSKTSPVETAWVRFVAEVQGTGSSGSDPAGGALELDDVMFGPSMPLAVRVGNVFMAGSEATTNAVFTIRDSELGTNALWLYLGAYDVQSGMARGTANSSTQSSVSVEGYTANNVANYLAAESSGGPSTTAGTFSVWRWNTLSAAQVNSMIAAGSNRVTARLIDDDDDRASDQAFQAGSLYGCLRVIDDDTNAPIARDLMLKGGETITDGDLRFGLWAISLTLEDYSGIPMSTNGNYLAPSYSLVNSSGDVVQADIKWNVSTKMALSNVWIVSRAANGIPYELVQTGLYRFVWSAQDLDNDRASDAVQTLNNGAILDGTNEFFVADDDEIPPTSPSNIFLSPVTWTNRNHFVLTFDRATDRSGIYEYRVSTNTAMPSTWLDGEPLPATYITNTLPLAISNGSFEVGSDELDIPPYPECTNSWQSYSDGGYLHFAGDIGGQDGSLASRHILEAGSRPDGSPRYTLCSQDVYIYNQDKQRPYIEFGGYFRGNLSRVGVGGNKCAAFLKAEGFNANSSRTWIVENEWDDDHNHAPLTGVNATTWTQNVLTVTNGSADTEFIRFSCGISGHNSALACTGYWDNLSFIVTMPTISGVIYTNAPSGITTNWFFSLDDDDDRVGDRLISPITNFALMFDAIAPTQIVNVSATPGADEFSEVEVAWSKPNDGGGVPGTPLSPWRAYKVYYTDSSVIPTTNSPHVSMELYPCLTNRLTESIVLSNMVWGTEYNLSVSGVDAAGNEGDLSPPFTVLLPGFFVTQGIVEASTPLGRADIAWTAANGVAYDLLYCDAADFSSALSNRWSKIGGIVGSMLSDTGDVAEGRAPPKQLGHLMRFYRAAQKDRWLTNLTRRIASEEVYVMKAIALQPGCNWVSFPGYPDTCTAARVLGHDLPSAAAEGLATRVSWYRREALAIATQTIWLSSSPLRWQLDSENADELLVPLEQGVVIEIPTNLPTAQTLLFIGRVPTNAMQQVISGGTARNPAYNFTSFAMPRNLHPSQMNLLESGFKGAGRPSNSDKLFKYDRINGQIAGAGLWFKTNDSTWRQATGVNGSLVSSGYFTPDDGILIMTIHTNDWTWTNRLLYLPPTKYMSP
ncbi:MAG TPA: hypothetical protein DCZ95_10410 [Verrucomicrobia bacterium]|nr:MAG: hypothetical protein A2X46_18735 [Lentisphaerae bacterium GWF2_57_35]HBA84494.1 hypothetical protein [Verrucomicrobiota bacterium]